MSSKDSPRSASRLRRAAPSSSEVDVAHGREAPVLDEVGPVVGPEMRLGVADVDDQQHGGQEVRLRRLDREALRPAGLAPVRAIDLALRLKGIEFRRMDMIPVVSKVQIWARFRGVTVPGIEFADGEQRARIAGDPPHSGTPRPEPPLLPADGHARRLVEEGELWGDQVLQPLARRIAWAFLKRRTGALMSYGENADLPVPDVMARLSAPVLAPTAAWFNGASDGAVRSDLINLDFHLDRADYWIERGAMGGEQPTAADLQVGAGIALLLTFGDIADRVGAHECARVARRWFPDYPGRMPAGVLPREWLDARPP